jgi:hypothetical protein
MSRRRRGSGLLMALMYVSLFGSLASGMAFMAQASTALSAGEDRTCRAYAAAESGMSYINIQLKVMPKPITSAGTVSGALATTLWTQSSTGVAAALATQLNGTSNLAGKTVSVSASKLVVPPIALGSDSSFQVTVTPDTIDPTLLHITSVGYCHGIIRGVTMETRIEKRIKYAVYSNVAIQLGKNVIVQGDVVSTYNGFGKGPPVWMLSDFRALTSTLDTDLTSFRAMLDGRDGAFANRINLNSSTLTTADKDALVALKAVTKVDTGTKDAGGNKIYTYQDNNGDGFVDEYDLFLGHIDANADKRVTQGEMTNPSTGASYDSELFTLIDSLNPPLTTSDPTRAGLNDGVIDNSDGYAKVIGSVKTAVTEAAWDTWARTTGSGGGTADGVGFREQFQGPVINPDATAPPVQFGVSSTDVPTMLPSNFDTSGYLAQVGTAAGTTTGSVASGAISNATLTSAMANGGTQTEGTPYGSTSIQATYKRPVFKNCTFTNVKIPKGLNALFENCTFKGVTYVDMATNITDSSGNTTTDPNAGMTYAEKMTSGTFSSTTALTSSNSSGFNNGNNLRFDGCTFNGPMTAAVPTAYTHFADSWEFTGSTLFNNTVDPTATILAPNTNIEMGSFSDPNSAPSTLKGVVVAGNIDIRGRSFVDGSVLVVGNGAGNTTLGYFGASDASSDPTAMPEGGYGRLYMRYNPSLALPNGINIPVVFTNQTGSYTKVNNPTWTP